MLNTRIITKRIVYTNRNKTYVWNAMER